MENTTRTPLPMATTGCACCAPAPDSGAEQEAPAGDPRPAGASEYRVEGMTCGHCVASVLEEISALDGVTAVDVDLVAGEVSTVTVTGPVSSDTVHSAIQDAGYTPSI
ncbi:heavy-metal-associated domain-containing protein [Micrococcus sp. IITD107]|uniref:heavy-metal-associated domain-containing protein n=1 Tax=Micrococcus sp. IITD107 TaxID=3342790 RepID=UPI0035B99CCA